MWENYKIQKKSVRFFIIVLFLSIIELNSIAQKIKIGLFPDKEIKTCVFSVVHGSYTIIADNSILKEAAPGEIYFIQLSKNKISISDSNSQIGNFKSIILSGTSNENVFQLKMIVPSSLSYDYDDDLEMELNENGIRIINHINIDNYITGVIEAEGGGNAHIEYYKAQAVLVRTYLAKNVYRHGIDGFNLCNNQHCQAYKGRSMLNREIHEATEATSGLVLTDTSNNLIVAPYHSNCGGYTGTADLVWQNHQPCLMSVKDPFCAGKANSAWKKNITLAEWTMYLKKNGLLPLNDNTASYSFVNNDRKKSVMIGKNELMLKKVREDFKIKSSFFSIQSEGNSVIFNGRGFGHGVGMCQEGAMEMAKVGYTFVDILHFYFQNVIIVRNKE